MSHRVFISYSKEDRAIADSICSAVERDGFDCWIAPRDIDPARQFRAEIVDAIERSRLMILILSGHSNVSDYVAAEVGYAFEHKVPILPLRLEDVVPAKSIELLIRGCQWMDAWRPAWPGGLPALVKAVRSHLTAPVPPGSRPAPACPALKLVITYKKNAQPDEDLVRKLETAFGSQGHDVFVDRHMKIGSVWLHEIEARVRQADAVITLVSASSVQSEMLAWEVQTAHDESQRREGLPRLFPVRVGFEGPLPPELEVYLGRLQYALWDGPEDDDRLLAELTEAFRNPRAPTPSRLVPVGGLPIDAEAYVTRATDRSFDAAVARRDSIVLIRGARQVGKTSLLARGLQGARAAGSAVAFTDFQRLNRSELASPEALYKALAAGIAGELDLDTFPEDGWDPRRAPNTNFERFLRREVLGKLEAPLVWAMDEVDRLFSCDFGSEVFGLFRSWHNARAMNPAGPWKELTMVISFATEAHLFITDLNQSPFNVGTFLSLEDFTPEQVADLDRRYGRPLRGDPSASTAFRRLVGGHPYLVNRGLYEMAERRLSVAEFAAEAEQDDGVFGDHLRRLLILLVKDPTLTEVVRGVLKGRSAVDPASFYRLRAAGVLAGDSAAIPRFRCQLYATFLERYLP